GRLGDGGGRGGGLGLDLHVEDGERQVVLLGLVAGHVGGPDRDQVVTDAGHRQRPPEADVVRVPGPSGGVELVVDVLDAAQGVQRGRAQQAGDAQGDAGRLGGGAGAAIVAAEGGLDGGA